MLVDLPGEAIVLATSLPLGVGPDDAREALIGLGEAVAAELRVRREQSRLWARVLRGEASRRHIAMELHDGLGATLTAAQLAVELARSVEDPPRAAEALDVLARTLRGGLDEMRVTLWNLEKRERSADEVIARLRRHVADVCESAGLRLTDAASGEWPDRIAAPVSLALIRVGQEAVTNVVRHARAQHLGLALRSDAAWIELEVVDDGIGVLAKDGDGASGRGLSNMRRRVEALGGSLEIAPNAPRGTRILARMPVEGGLACRCDGLPCSCVIA
jgi:signal transduction histidine kinase